MTVDKRNIILNNVTEQLSYRSKPRPIATTYPSRDVYAHASKMKRQLETCAKQAYSQKQVAAIKYKKGMYLEFSGDVGCELATKSLENIRAGIRLLNVKEENDVVKATVYVPEGKENFFLKRVTQYASERTVNGKPKNENLIGSIENIKLALLESFWTDNLEDLPNETKQKCEVWFRYEVRNRGKDIDSTPWNTVDEIVTNTCVENGIQIEDKKIVFPERIVKLITANKEELKILISACEYVTEIRRAAEPNLFFSDLEIVEQREWVDNLVNRVDYSKKGVAVCLLDAGINQNHPLIKPATIEEHIQTINLKWGVEDNVSFYGHGTEMAGLILYNDLKGALITSNRISVPYELESVKILPPYGENAADMYGEVTIQAVARAEIENPFANRLFCMPVTSTNNTDKDGRPTSWSAAIDSIASGADGDNIKRLFIVSAGNISPCEFQDGRYPDYNVVSSIQDPAQSWNAITVVLSIPYCQK